MALALAASARTASGDPDPTPPPTNIHIHSASSLHTDGGSDLRLPPGYFLDEPAHDRLDTEMRRLQDAETRLGAENTSLRASTQGWQPGWYTVAGIIATSLAAGWYLHDKL